MDEDSPKLEVHSIEVHNSRWPLDHLTLTFDLIFIGGRGIVTSLWTICVPSLAILASAVLVLSCDRQNHRGG